MQNRRDFPGRKEIDFDIDSQRRKRFFCNGAPRHTLNTPSWYLTAEDFFPASRGCEKGMASGINFFNFFSNLDFISKRGVCALGRPWVRGKGCWQ
jgi:hypothetical protein